MVKHDRLSDDIQTSAQWQGQEVYIPAIPEPFWTTKGLPFWKRFNERNWRPQCRCGRIFDNKEDYQAHIIYIIYKNPPYGQEQN